MAKLVIEVLDASDLMPKDKREGANTFVEVEFEDQRQRTSTNTKDLSPFWNEKLVFNIKNPTDLPNRAIQVHVYNDNNHGNQEDFLGEVRISGMSVPFSEQEATAQRYSLDKRGSFSHLKGDVALKIYAVTAEEIITNKIDDEYWLKESHEKNKNEKETGCGGGGGRGPPPPPAEKPVFVKMTTSPDPDLVVQMNLLYVRVVKAKDLAAMDISGRSLNPYVEVKVGSDKGETKHLAKNRNPIWNAVFAFSEGELQSNSIEVALKDKEDDSVVGKVAFDVAAVPRREPPESPLFPQWYKLAADEREREEKAHHQGEIMLAVWMGTRADEAFLEARLSDAHSICQGSLASTRSKVYFSPKLYYLKIHVIAAQDLVPSRKGRRPDAFVRVQLGHQIRVTRHSPIRFINPEWNEDFMFVVAEPFDEYIVIRVQDRVAKGKDEVIAKMLIPVREIPHRIETKKLPDPRWFSLQKPSVAEQKQGRKTETKFTSRILLRLWIDAGYHVLDESTHFSSDLQPSSRHLRKPSIGILEVGILSAQNLVPMKARDGKLKDAYCVVKYQNKWVRTRTLVDTLNPHWNEQYTWEVYDPCTVATIAVFDNCHINGKDDVNDQKIGKVRIRLSTLETDRLYAYCYPLLVLTPSGLKKNGEIHLAIRFTCTDMMKMLVQYGKPLLPEMHYVDPIPVAHVDWLQQQAMQTVAARLFRAEPPLRREVVEYMLDVDYHMFSLRRSKANFFRIMSVLSGILYVCRWFDGICHWKNRATTILVHVSFLILVYYPNLIIPLTFLYLSGVGMWNYRFRMRYPPHVDARLSQAESTHPDELDEEFDTFPASSPLAVVRMRYDWLRSIAARVQVVIGDLATLGERASVILRWKDPRATTIFIIFLLISFVFLYATPFKVVVAAVGLYLMRHPRLRSKMPSAAAVFLKRLPADYDSTFDTETLGEAEDLFGDE